ncbi:nitronate monooxygenase [Acididesulfobacillus acetoxydans]|uniref:Probable nitronate monooxygenase n=1 Tax=Acididesulfobacillus acetoxydans TaxID=1561005 RepID=A0A8S0Y437_9FIRM|nr:nitronate monooxygenase [Acididesulfobacillus acetoxydans]CAA7602725.1 nitronate monooxygenase [Acididesulfobacillus acetoxydans]CEJ06418.1 2-nitropropane dioxygenase [Acididesulfobacillus acetoxydans]
MQIPELRLKNLVAKVPVIQGGMAVRISLAPLAAAVAEEGGIGLIAGSGMSVPELRSEIREARRRTSGIIGVNIMFAVREFAQLAQAALEEKIDLLVSGAGFSRDMFAWGEETKTAVVPIVSSAKLARLAEKLGAAAVIVEGNEAGGHLGTERSMREILPEVKETVRIPVIGAGGVMDGRDVVEVLRLGADGVQMGTRFALSEESSAAPEYKAYLLGAGQEDMVIIHSPVGLPGRGIRNPFTDSLARGDDVRPLHCMGCLKKCEGNFCIITRLMQAQRGDMQEGLVFSGSKFYKAKEVLSVRQIFDNIKQEILQA